MRPAYLLLFVVGLVAASPLPQQDDYDPYIPDGSGSEGRFIKRVRPGSASWGVGPCPSFIVNDAEYH